MTRRIPRASTVTLDQRRLFIFPSRAGMGFLVLLLLLLLIAINYQNNLIYGLVFLLGTVFVITIHLTFANLHGLTITGTANECVFSGESGSINFDIETNTRARSSITLKLDGNAALLDFAPSAARVSIAIGVTTRQRGQFPANRLLVETRYPLGLVRCWTWLDVAAPLWVYPKSMPTTIALQRDLTDTQGTSQRVTPGGDDIHNFRAYQHGDALRDVHWPSVARGGAPEIRVRGDQVSESPDIIDFEDYPNTDIETRLSWLCFRVLNASAAERRFLLRLPNREIVSTPQQGMRAEALMALAQFDQSEASEISSTERVT